MVTEKNTNILQKNHKLCLDERQDISISGVLKVEAFSDKEISLLTVMGKLTIKGENLHIEKLNVEAAEQSMSLNQYIRLLLITHLAKEPVPTTKEVQALRDSNYQLHKLGVNINQVAKAINSGSATSLTLKELQNISDTIDNHFGKVGTLLQAARRRI